MEKVTASSLLEQQERLEEAKRTAINDLLDERNILQESTDRRLGEIAADLKALGYTYPRKPREAKQEPGQSPEIAPNDTQSDAGSEPWSETGAGNPAAKPSKKKKK